MTATRKAYVGLGANLADREATLREAVRRLERLGRVSAVSSIYETEPVGYSEQPPFLNAVVELESALTPRELVGGFLAIEKALGRVRTFRNAPRTLDLDLLLLGEERIESPEVQLPHPRMHERAFVLVPLAEIAPNVVHPALRKSALELLAHLPSTEGVRRVASAEWEHIPRDERTWHAEQSPRSIKRVPPRRGFGSPGSRRP